MNNNNEIREEQIVFGWNSVEDAAKDVYYSMHRTLLEGKPVFLYKATNLKSELCQVVVVKNISPDQGYGVGIITSGWTALYPKVPYEFLEGDLHRDLVKWKVEGDVVKVYDQIINQEKK